SGLRIVIQCAGRKAQRAGKIRTPDGREVMFVADPLRAPQHPDVHYARPDDTFSGTHTWRDFLIDYNQSQVGNPLALLPAYQLYENRAYQDLVAAFGIDRIYILSAGWGLVEARYLLPDYDITFSSVAEPFNRRRRQDNYRDFCRLVDETDDIVFLG